MTPKDSNHILEMARAWYQSEIINSQIRKVQALSINSFNINPFTAPYLSSFLTGTISADGIARALVYARVLGTSLATTFGTNLQSFISSVLSNADGSVVEGIDIEFIDKIDGRKKYAQLKAGPNTINSGDVDTIHNHFRKVRNLARTNRLELGANDLVIGILYGSTADINSSYCKLRDHHFYPVYVGSELWYRLTGDVHFYTKLIRTFAEIEAAAASVQLIESKIQEIAQSEEVLYLVELAKQRSS
jgi:hypothetical protein